MDSVAPIRWAGWRRATVWTKVLPILCRCRRWRRLWFRSPLWSRHRCMSAFSSPHLELIVVSGRKPRFGAESAQWRHPWCHSSLGSITFGDALEVICCGYSDRCPKLIFINIMYAIAGESKSFSRPTKSSHLLATSCQGCMVHPQGEFS